MGIGISKTTQLAQGANKLPLDVRGQTASPITIQCITSSGFKNIYLGLMLVVNALGTICLIGEPGKVRNKIICPTEAKIGYSCRRQ